VFRHRARAPRFSFITAVYESEPYLPEFLDSLAALDVDRGDLEVLFVDDASPDNSAALIKRWIRRTRAPARILRQPHGGSTAARNTGLRHARGNWVSFPDPDDALDPAYLAAVSSFLADAEAAGTPPSQLAPMLMQFYDVPANAVDNHPLGYRYHEGRRLVHLDAEPRWFHNHAPSGFYRRSVIERAHLRFDPELSAGFEDARFGSEYLLQFDDPVLGVVPDAVYRYRRRTTSVTGTMWAKPARYTSVPEHGYLPLLTAKRPPPAWLQLLVLYDLVWYFYEYDRPDSENRTIDGALAARFLELLDRVLAYIDEPFLAEYPMHPLPRHIRVALAARKTGSITNRGAVVTADGEAYRITWYRMADEPDVPVEVLRAGTPIPGEHRSRPIEYYGEVFVVEHTVHVGFSEGMELVAGDERFALSPPS